jgi:hypothetical protein
LKRHQTIVNKQRDLLNKPKINHFIAKIPFENEPFTIHNYMIIPGILSHYNFFNTQLDATLKTRIFSDQYKFVHILEPKFTSKPFDSSPKKIEPSRDPKPICVNSIRKKRLFANMKERIANDLLTPQSNFYYKKSITNMLSPPKFCESNKKGICSNCNAKCSFTVDEINNRITVAQLKKELKDHFHPQSRQKVSIVGMKEELLEHYNFTHQNFGENSPNKKIYCYCKKEETEISECMIMCDLAEKCDEGEWFHVSCIQNEGHFLPKDLDDTGNI